MAIPNRLRRSNKYRLLGLVGQGQFGQVFCAVHRKTGQIVALKNLDHARFPTHKFLRELRFLLSLQHPNIVNCQALEHTATGRYLVMDYCEAGTLRQMVESEVSLSLPQKLQLISDVLRGLDHAHDRGIVHCDIKPENILLTAKPGGWLACISDFGIARLAQNESLASEGNTGSPAYMAPERFYGQYSASSDLYAVGVMLYELLLGDRPFSGTPQELMLAHMNRSLSVPTGIPPNLRDILVTALQKIPARRFHSAAEMLAAVQAIDPSTITDLPTPTQSQTTDTWLNPWQQAPQPAPSVVIYQSTAKLKTISTYMADGALTVPPRESSATSPLTDCCWHVTASSTRIQGWACPNATVVDASAPRTDTYEGKAEVTSAPRDFNPDFIPPSASSAPVGTTPGAAIASTLTNSTLAAVPAAAQSEQLTVPPASAPTTSPTDHLAQFHFTMPRSHRIEALATNPHGCFVTTSQSINFLPWSTIPSTIDHVPTAQTLMRREGNNYVALHQAGRWIAALTLLDQSQVQVTVCQWQFQADANLVQIVAVMSYGQALPGLAQLSPPHQLLALNQRYFVLLSTCLSRDGQTPTGTQLDFYTRRGDWISQQHLGIPLTQVVPTEADFQFLAMEPTCPHSIVLVTLRPLRIQRILLPVQPACYTALPWGYAIATVQGELLLFNDVFELVGRLTGPPQPTAITNCGTSHLLITAAAPNGSDSALYEVDLSQCDLDIIF